jgi:transposase InsO family protein
MGAQGSALDNAVAESFFASLKKDLINRYSWPTKADARVASFEWIEAFYNRIRLHSTLGCLSPTEFEQESHLIKMKKEENLVRECP